jgi:hypothetical protein
MDDRRAFSKFLEQRPVETTGGTIVDIFDGGLMAQPGVAQTGVQARLVTKPVATIALSSINAFPSCSPISRAAGENGVPAHVAAGTRM